MQLDLINPSNPQVSIVKIEENRWNRYRVWKPLGLMAVAGLTPPEWEITIFDENVGVPDYAASPGRTWWASPRSPRRRTAPTQWPLTSADSACRS